VGLIVDAYHVWWDPEVYAQIAAARGRIMGFHVSDWLVPTPDQIWALPGPKPSRSSPGATWSTSPDDPPAR